jgi:hypothetical protein
MPFRGTLIQLHPWNGGLDIVSNPALADPQKLSSVDNIDFLFDGTRVKRGGVALYNQATVLDTEEAT